MELRSTRDPDINNPATMSMLEYLRKKGIEAMSGTCKYPESVCPHMTVLKGALHCDTTPCQLMGEFPRQSNAERIREMTDEELAKSFFQSLVLVRYVNISTENLIGVERTAVSFV